MIDPEVTEAMPTGQHAAPPEPAPTPAVPVPEMRWISILRDSDGPKSHADLFEAAFRSLARQLALRPGTPDQLRIVLSRSVDSAPPQRALGVVTDALKTLLGPDAAYLLHWLTYEETSDRLAQIDSMAPAEVQLFLREVVSEHSATFDQVQRAAQVSPEDWLDAEPRLIFDVSAQQFRIALTIVRIDHARVHLEMSPNSALALISRLLVTVSEVRDPGPFDEAIVQRWFEASVQVQEMLARSNGDLETPGNEQPGGDGAP